MPTYFELLGLILPVFAMIAIGSGARFAGWLTPAADVSLMKLVVNVLYPALIFRAVLGNPALSDPRNVYWPPLIGFVTMAFGILAALWIGRRLGFEKGQGLRTFAFAAGIYNYGYIPIPLMEELFGPDSIGVLLVHNVGCEAAVWTVGVLVVSGVSLRDGWRRLISGPVIALLLATVGNVVGLDEVMPTVADRVISTAGACAIPMGLIAIGATLAEYLTKPSQLFSRRITPMACALRLGLFPAVFLVVAKVLPISPEMKRVMIVEAAMPAGIIPILIAKHYGGQPLTAVQVVLGTTAVGLVAIPLWLRLGLSWVM
ncbi:AEC family transporter [Synoicihabitans lomoniglobus]|uniref:AEC family transporter n=1 Tax=Synoicihabitans lomoniglobus TaxID=2909285 RepID=A0AAE9ZUW9_9BACT|nr:AEC family transporter [Opitutaceae bacterium LMO-M01]WED63791.1 AEC family transporter [Opitutaceae bacterium LMO-M01]